MSFMLASAAYIFRRRGIYSIISYDVCRDGALAERMEKLTPKQRAFALEILDSYIKAVNN